VKRGDYSDVEMPSCYSALARWLEDRGCPGGAEQSSREVTTDVELGAHSFVNSSLVGAAKAVADNWCNGTGHPIPADPSEPCETPGVNLGVGKATVQLESTASGQSMRTLTSNDHKSWPVAQRAPARLLRAGVMELASGTTSSWGLCKAPASDPICGA
jgi:hypothetical protein